MPTQNAHDFEFTSLIGKDPLKLSDFKGKVLLIVNTASWCGFTPQYAELQKLQDTYGEKGLVVVGVPSANFGNQEFDQSTEIKTFTEKEFTVTFRLTSITVVKGDKAHPFYTWASEQAGRLGSPKWNFHKYLIDKKGDFVTWFAPTTSPISDKVTTAIEDALEAPFPS